MEKTYYDANKYRIFKRSNGLRRILDKHKKLYNYINDKEELLFNEWLAKANDFHGNIAIVKKEKNSNKYCIINTNGKTLYKDIEIELIKLKNGHIVIRNKDNKSNIISKNGELMFKKWYKKIDVLTDRYIKVLYNNGNCNIFDAVNEKLVFDRACYYIQLLFAADFLVRKKHNDMLMIYSDETKEFLPVEFNDLIYYFYNRYIVSVNGILYLIDNRSHMININNITDYLLNVKPMISNKEQCFNGNTFHVYYITIESHVKSIPNKYLVFLDNYKKTKLTSNFDNITFNEFNMFNINV